MVVITGICLVVQADVVRYRPLLLVLAAGKAASSLAALGFYLFDEDVFVYLLNFLVDGYLALVALWLWSLAGRVGRARRARLKARAGARAAELRTLSAICEAMAPGYAALPAAERDVDVSGPVARFLARSRRACCAGFRLGLRAFERLPFPWRFSRLDLAAREDFLRGWRARASASTTTCCCWRRSSPRSATRSTPRSRSGSATRSPAGSPTAPLPEPRRLARRHRASGRGEECDVVDRRLGRGRRGRGGRARRGRARRDRARGGRPLRPRHLSRGPDRRDRHPLSRRRADGRRGPPADPGPGRPRGRRHDGDQLGHLLPRPRRRCSTAGARASGSSWAARPRRRVRRGRGVPARHAGGPRADGAQRPAGDGGRRGARRQRRPDRPQRRQLRPVQLLPLRLRDRRQARHARLLPAPGGRRRGAGARRASRCSGSSSRTGARPASSASRRREGAATAARAATRCAPGGRDRGRRRLRHAGAAAALGPRRRPGRAQPAHPPGLLGRRPLRRGGARLGRA